MPLTTQETRSSILVQQCPPTLDLLPEGVRLLDQTRLPDIVAYQLVTTADEMIDAIQTMVVRGAPAIGIAGAFGLVLAARQWALTGPPQDDRTYLIQIAERLAQARPTAVNLQWAIARMLQVMTHYADAPPDDLVGILEHEAQAILDEDVAMCQAIGQYGASLVPKGARILTHCNAGALATAGYGTALGVIRSAFAQDPSISVFADETRPRLQGARLTTWEMVQEGIPVTLIADNMAAWAMKQGQIDLVVVGADRIARNGDTANKIGTYSLALAAKAHNIPFYVAAPTSTIDFSIDTGDNIPIEERAHDEVTCVNDGWICPHEGVHVYNPAFDVTPNDLITALITEKGICRPPFAASIPQLNA